jgi:hypothetical protein
MAPLRSKKPKNRKTRLSMRAISSSAKLKDTAPTLIPIENSTLTGSPDFKPYSCSLPGSPVFKITQSYPTLSASSEICRPDTNSFLIPSKACHGSAENPFLTRVDFEDRTRPRASTKFIVRDKGKKGKRSSPVAANFEVPQEADKHLHTQQIQEVAEDSLTGVSTSKVDSTLAETFENSTPADPISSSNPQIQIEPLASLGVNISEVVIEKEPEKFEAFSTLVRRDTVSRNCLPFSSPPHHPDLHSISALNQPHYQHTLTTMSHSNGFPSGYPYDDAPPPCVGSPYQMPYSNYSGSYRYRQGSPRQGHDSVGSRRSNRDDPSPVSGGPPGDTGPATEDDPGDLVSRIASVIPDIHMLLNRSKETHGELSLRDQLLRKTEAQSAESLKQKEDHVNQLTKRLQDAERYHAGESNKHRLQIGSLEDKQKELEERLRNAELSKKATEDLKLDLEDQKAALLGERMTLAKVAAEEKDRMFKDFDDWKKKTEESLDVEKQKCADAMAQKKEIEGGFDKMRKDFEAKLSKTQEDLEDSIKTERENREQWIAEREMLAKGWDEERANLKKEIEDQQQTLSKQHEVDMAAQTTKSKEEIHDLLMSFAKIQEGLNKDYTIEIDNLKQELARQKDAWDKEREELRSMVAGVNVAAKSLEAEKGRLQKLVDSFGEVADIKSKGDAY